MIPVAVPSTTFLLLVALCIVATLFGGMWSIRLVFSALARQRLRGWRRIAFAVLASIGLCSIAIIFWWHHILSADEAAYRANFRPSLATAQRLGGIDMPSGTMLTLGIARQPQSFRKAEFPHPITIGTVEAKTVERYLRIQTDQAYETLGFIVENLRLTGQGTSMQEGWTCDAHAEIVFTTGPDGDIESFERCKLAKGNLIEDVALPEGTEVVATNGSVYPDGHRGQDRWLLYLPGAATILLHGTKQIEGSLKLDAKRRLLGQDETGAQIR